MTEQAASRPTPVVPNNIALSEPLRWLRAGWSDFLQAPLIGLFFGACYMMMGLILYRVMQYSSAWVLILSAGFLLLGPFLAMGLYSVSRSLEQGERPELGRAMTAWDRNAGALVPYLMVLLVLEMLWSRSAMIVFALSFDMLPAESNPLSLLLDPANLQFTITYVLVGAVFASIIFLTSVVSIPLIMDRDIDGITAGLTSIRVCLNNPGTLFWWGAMVTVLIVAAMLPYFAGLLIVAPVIGHATWHAYRACVLWPNADPDQAAGTQAAA